MKLFRAGGKLKQRSIKWHLKRVALTAANKATVEPFETTLMGYRFEKSAVTANPNCNRTIVSFVRCVGSAIERRLIIEHATQRSKRFCKIGDKINEQLLWLCIRVCMFPLT